VVVVAAVAVEVVAVRAMVGVLRLVAVVLDAEAGVAIVRSAVPKGVLSYRYKAARTLPCRRALPAFGRRDFWVGVVELATLQSAAEVYHPVPKQKRCAC